MGKRLICALTLLLACGALSRAELVPNGSEFQVNTYTPGWQEWAAAASDSEGNSVIVWSGRYQDGSSDGVFGQRFDSSGNPLSAEFQVNTYTTGDQDHPAVAMSASGAFVVVWEDGAYGLDRDGSDAAISGQLFDSSGSPVGSDFQVNTETLGMQALPAVAMDATGGFVVVWRTPDYYGPVTAGQRFSSNGLLVGSEFRMTTYVTYPQDYPDIAMSADGDFAVVWQSDYRDGSGAGIFGRRFTSTGVVRGADFQINTYTLFDQAIPAIGMDEAGDFAVVWQSPSQNGSYPGIFGQIFHSTGAPLGAEFQVNTYTAYGYIADVAMNSAGDFLVVWDSVPQDGDSVGVFAQKFDSLGFPSGSEFQVNSYTTDAQGLPSVSGDPNGNWIIAWQSNLQDGSQFGVFAQQYSEFDSGLTADISVTQFDVVDPVVFDDPVTYVLTVKNFGPDATDVELTDTLPSGVTFVSATPDRGSCSTNAGFVRCLLGTVDPGTSVSVTLVVAPQTSGIQLINEVSVSSPAYDPTSFDRSASETTSIVGPYIGDRVWEDRDGDGIQDAGEPGAVSALVYLYSSGGSLLDVTFTDTSGQYRFDIPTSSYFVRFIPPPGYVLSPSHQGGDDLLDSDADPATGNTPIISPLGQLDATRWDAGVIPTLPCVPPDEPIYVYDMTLSTDGNNYPILHFMDANRLEQITGYNVYRSSDPAPPPSSWPLAASDIIDMDEATPNKQWVDTSGDASPSGMWYYQVTAYNNRCPAEGPF